MKYFSKTQSKLRPGIVAKIRKSKHLKIQLMILFNISPSTLQLWLDKNNKSFTQMDSLELIREYFHIETVEELLDIDH